MRFKCKEIEGR